MTDTKYTPVLNYSDTEECNPNKWFDITFGDTRFVVFFEERNLNVRIENLKTKKNETMNLRERLWVPSLGNFARSGVVFRVITTDQMCLFQLPRFEYKCSHVILPFEEKFQVRELTDVGFSCMAKAILNQVLMEKEIKSLDQENDSLDKYLQKWKDYAADLEKEIASYKEKLAEKEQKLAEKEQKLAEKEECIGDLSRNTLLHMWSDASCSDFVIKCPTCEFPVHKAVLARFWPFFKTMLENDCKEVNENAMSLDFPSETVEIFLSYVYGKRVHAEELTFDTAIRLMEMAGMYQMPHLADTAYEKVLLSEPDLKLADCVNGWKSARLGDHGPAKKFFSGKVAEKMKKKDERDKEDFEEIDREELLELFMESMDIGV